MTPNPASQEFVRRDALLAAIVESSDDAIIAKDLNGVIQSWNRGAERIFGYTADEMIGQPVSVLAPPGVNEMETILSRIRAGERIDHYETYRRRKDGRILTVSLTVSPIRNEAGEIIGASKIARDVTDRIEVERKLQVTQDQLMLLVEASGALLASPHSDEVLSTILGLAGRLVAADAYSVWRRGADDVWRVALSTGLSQEFLASANIRTPTAMTVPSVPMVFNDVDREPILAERRSSLAREGIRSMLAIPLNMHGTPAGTVVFYWRTKHNTGDAEIRVANALGNLAASALGTAELYERELELRAEAEAAERRASFLAEAGAVLASSLDYEETLASIARLAVPTFADWAAVDIVDDGGQVRRVAVTHSDPGKVRLAQELRERYPVRENDVTFAALRDCSSVLLQEITDEVLTAAARDAQHLRRLRELGLHSALVAPMVLKGRAVGVITFVTAESGRRYADSDLRTAEEIARRAATAFEHAALYRDVRASEERYRSLVSATTSVVWTTDPEGAVVSAQDSWEAYTGQPWQEQKGFGWMGALHPEDREALTETWVRSRDSQTTYELGARIWHAPTGGYRYCIARAAPVKNADGSVREWIGTVSDVHKRHVAEQERAAALEREQEARQTAELLNRIGPVLAAELDPGRLTESITDIATALVGAKFGALFYTGVDEQGEATIFHAVSGAPPEGFDRLPETPQFERTLREKQVVRGDDAGAARSYLSVPVVSRSGEVLGALLFGHPSPGMFTDRHERIVSGIAGQAAIALDNARLFKESQQSRQALERSNEELRQANADLEQFAYSASHDLKEPLRMVAVYSQLLQKRFRGKLDAQADEYLDFMVQGARRMDMLVRDLLAYTQAVTAEDGSVTAAVDANAILNQVLQNLKASLDESGATVDAGELPTALAMRETHLLQVLQNVIGNALKYRGEAAPEIRVRAEQEHGAWKLSVADNGIGVPPQYCDQIFGIFRRLHPSERYPGTGIGLAICQKIIQSYGGRIWVESDGDGKGSTFCFTVPERE